MYTAGIVGCGVIGNRLAGAFEAHDDTEIGAACDLVESRVESFVTEYDARAYTDHRDLVADEEVDIVYVGVPPKHHHEVVSDALDAGKHVICEKPIAENAEAGAEMVVLAEETDGVTAINLPFRYTPGFRELVERVTAGETGEVKRVNLDFRFPQWPREWQDVAWLEGHEQGGPLREVGTHFLFGVQELFGPIDRVSAQVQYSSPGRYEESIACHFSVDQPAGVDRDRLDGTIDLVCDHDQSEENSITVLGSDGQLSLVEWYRLVADRHEPGERVLNEERADTSLVLVDEFVAELAGEGGDLVSFREAQQVQEVVDAIFDSEGTTVDLNIGLDIHI